jgi:hypothetical protein
LEYELFELSMAVVVVVEQREIHDMMVVVEQ